MKTPMFFPALRRGLLCADLCFLLCACAMVCAQELRIENVTIDATGRIQLRHAADPNSYYILYRGAEVTRILTAADLALGGSGTGELRDQTPISPTAHGFYRIQRVSINEPLDTDADGIDDVYELRNSDLLNPLLALDATLDFDGDGTSNLTEYRQGTDPRVSVPLATITSSPFNGETGVAVTRETIVRFSVPLAENATLGLQELYAEFGGRRLLSRVEMASDRKSATLFYLENLPGSSRVQVILNASSLKDARGLLVDADGDGAPGGVATIEFDTLSITEVTGTAVIGRVFASELVTGAGGAPSSVNRPLAGVTITVDGREETLRSVTDAMGNFKLEPVPAGRFFVHVDGRTAEGSAWPTGAYYPVVGKAWEAAPGRADNLAGGTGEVYLPLIVPGSLQRVSPTQDTPITFPQEVLDKNAALVGVSITVPANSLFSENGTRGGMVGLAPVPPDRLPEKLPPGLNFPLVITVQTDGPANFDRPVPVRFPNLPDPVTGQKLAPGAKSALWSFNHDTGQWEIVGPMTVSADGNFVESDAGFGILQPGWHGSQSGSPTSGPKGSTKNPCEGLSTRKIIENVIDLGVGAAKCALEFGGLRDSFKKALSIAAELKKLVDNAQKLYDDAKAGRDVGTARNTMKVILNGKKIIIDAIEAFKQQSLFAKISKIAKCAEGILSALDGVCGRSVKGGDGPCSSSVWVRLVCIGISEAKTIVAALNREAEAFEQSLTKAAIKTACLLIDIGATQLGLLPEGAALQSLQRPLADSDPVPPELIAQMEEMLQSVKIMDSELLSIGEFAQRALDFDAKMTAIIQNIANFYTEQIGLPGNAYYLIEIAGQKIRGKTDERGQIRQILAPNVDYTLSIYDHYNGRIGVVTSRTAPNGFSTEIPLPLFELPENVSDLDGDALLDVFENVVGTDLNKADTDGDGIRDAAEVLQGTDPLSGLAARTGLAASIKTPGNAVDICAVNNLALIAAENAGLIICNIFNGLNPTIIGQVDTPGSAVRVACAGNLAAVADGSAGLALIDIGNPSNARITHQSNLGSSALSVTTAGSVAFVGLSSGEVAAVDMLTGAVLHRQALSGPVQDLAFAGLLLYALTETTLHVLSFEETQLTALSSLRSPFVATPNRRLFVGGNVAYAVHGKGYNTIDISDPRNPRLIKASNTAQFGWRQIALNGSGLGVAVVDQNAGFDGPNDVSLYNTADPLQTDRLIATFATPGIARAVSIFDGIAYVADGPAGLAVINYLAYDSQNQPPAVSLVTSDADSIVEEGQPLSVRAEAADDVQVRRVEFLMDGASVATDGNFLFEHQLIAPKILPGDDTFTLQAIATDTGGNRTTSSQLSIKLIPDATPPRISRTIPASGAGVFGSRRVAVYFNEPVNLDTISSDHFFVAEAGPDGKLGTADDLVLPGGTFSFDEMLNAVFLAFPNDFGLGTYQLVVRNVTDLAGNPLPGEVTSPFFAGMGLTGEYYDNENFTDLKLTRLDASVHFDWGTGSPDPVINGELFSVRWRGFVVPRFSETYTFYTISDDGVRMWVNNQLLIDNWTVHGAIENQSQPISLVAGQRYAIQMEFYERSGLAVAKLFWSSASQVKEAIGPGQLLPYEDSTPPIMLAAEPDFSFRHVRLHFSEPLDPGTANDFANYSLSGGVSVIGAELQSNGTEVVLTTSRQTEATRYTVTANGLRDASDRANVIVAGSQVQFTSYAVVTGSLRREVYQQIAGGLVSDLTASTKFPLAPDVIDFVSSFEAPSNSGDNYGQRLSGFVVPPLTGEYVFYLSADDQAELYLSTDDDPANAVLVASEPQWNAARAWQATSRRTAASPENRSGPIRLEAGRRYYIAALHKEGGVSDNLAVTWHLEAPVEGRFHIEAEDFNFGGGQHRAEASTMPYRGGAYQGVDGIKGIDWDGGTSGPSPYRPLDPEIGMGTTTDDTRDTYELATDYKVGWNDVGDWYNYTRVFPAGPYHVYARMASGGADMQARLDEVTDGAKTSTQTLSFLGRFKGPRTANYDTFTFVPLQDESGRLARVALSGERTLRLTVEPGNFDINYLWFVPAIEAPEDLPLTLPPADGSSPIPGKYLATFASPDGSGYLIREVFANVSGGSVKELTDLARFPNDPDEVGFLRSFEAPSDAADNYGQVVSGLITPPVTGDYIFYLASNDQSALFLSPTDLPADKVQIAMEPIWSGRRAWSSTFQRNSAAPENRSAPITLTAGRKYYIEARMKEAFGGDHLGVAWQIPGSLQPSEGGEPIGGLHLSLLSQAGPAVFTSVPQNQTVAQGQPATFSVRAVGAPPLRFQWLRNGVAIKDANGRKLTLPAVALSESGAVFAVEVTSGGGIVTSPGATLTVTP